MQSLVKRLGSSRSLSKKEVTASSAGHSELALSDGSTATIDAAEEEACEMWGVPPEQEWALVEQLRSEVELEAGPLAPEWDDHVLRRFLRARKHNIYKSKLMFLDQLKWRSEAQVDTVLTDFDFSEEREEFFKWYPEGFFGTDRVGRPIYVQQPGKIDTLELWKCTTLERCIRYHLQQQERYWRIIAPACSVAAGRLREQSLVLIDMEGMGVTTMSSEVRSIMATIMKIDQDYFPELMWKACLINAPVSFRVIWAMIKHLMDARTQAKIEVLGSNYQEELLRLIPPENLLECYGGTSKAPLWAELGPWKDPAVMVQVELRRQQRIREAGRPASMPFPAVPGAEGSAEAAAEAGDNEVAGASADEGISKGSAVAHGAFQEAS